MNFHCENTKNNLISHILLSADPANALYEKLAVAEHGANVYIIKAYLPKYGGFCAFGVYAGAKFRVGCKTVVAQRKKSQ